MPRRVKLPGASELFRPTSAAGVGADTPAADASAEANGPSPSGRVRHEEKITVYVSSDELLALEQLRLNLRGRHGVAVDRGRIVRAAIAEALADVADNGGESRLIQRLTQP